MQPMWLLLAAAHAEPGTIDFEVSGHEAFPGSLTVIDDTFDALNSGAFEWNLTYTTDSADLPFEQNGVSQLLFAEDEDWDVAAAWGWIGDSHECDIIVNTDYAFTMSSSKVDSSAYAGSERTFGSVLVHELGHCLGIGHVSSEYNIMGSDRSHVGANGDSLYFYLGEDGTDRLIDGGDYTLVSSFEDIGIVHWRYAGNPDGDAYSNHERTTVTSTGSEDLPSFLDAGEPVFLVRRGTPVLVQFTYENNGATDDVEVDYDFVLSTNDTISSSDPVIGSTTLMLDRGDVATYATQLEVSSSTAPGRYTFGVRATDLIGLSDDIAQNNQTYVDIEVLANGDPDFCQGPEPCARFEGDCDSNAECASPLVCIHDQGDEYGLDPDVDVCDFPLGDANFCDESAPCARDEGDCDNDDECVGSLQCLSNVGADYGWDPAVDVCGYPEGHASYCSILFPCGRGEGDCDSNLECAFGTCQMDVGASYGFDPTVDVCDLGFGLSR